MMLLMRIHNNNELYFRITGDNSIGETWMVIFNILQKNPGREENDNDNDTEKRVPRRGAFGKVSGNACCHDGRVRLMVASSASFTSQACFVSYPCIWMYTFTQYTCTITCAFSRWW